MSRQSYDASYAYGIHHPHRQWQAAPPGSLCPSGAAMWTPAGSGDDSPPPEPRSRSPLPEEESASPLPRLSRRRSSVSPERRPPAPACGSTRALLARAAAACAAARGPAAASLPRLSLGTALQRGLGSVSGGRAAFVQCHLTSLEAPAAALAPLLGARTLLLSRNALRSLATAPPALLRSLTALSLAHNCIDDVGTLEFLGAACPALTSLSLAGNPLCELLDARAHALAALPLLRTVDGRDAGADERRQALATVRGGATADTALRQGFKACGLRETRC